MVVDLGFMIAQFGPLNIELTRLLGVRFIPGSPANDTPVGRALATILHRQNEGNLHGRDVHFIRMFDLVEHLRTIESRDPQMLAVYRKKLTDPNLGNFYGTRFEIFIAALLLAKDVDFRRRAHGGPDFEGQRAFADAGVECASAHFADATKSTYALEKLATIVATKAGKPYATLGNALFVDVTNLQAASIDHGQGAFHGDAARLGAITDESGFGGMFIWWTQHTVKDGRVTERHHRYRRFTMPSAAAPLTALLASLEENNYKLSEPDDWRVPYET